MRRRLDAALTKDNSVTQCDITQRDEVEHLVAGLAAPIDLLVIRAAINVVVPFTDVDEDLYDAVFSVKAKAPFSLHSNASQCWQMALR